MTTVLTLAASLDIFQFVDFLYFEAHRAGWYRFAWPQENDLSFPFNVSIRNRHTQTAYRNFPVWPVATTSAPVGGGELLIVDTNGFATWQPGRPLVFLLELFLDSDDEVGIYFDATPSENVKPIVSYLGPCRPEIHLGVY